MDKAGVWALIVEDSDEDYVMAKRGLLAAGFRGDIRRCETGDQALIYLREILDSMATLPVVVLLDLNLPGTDGCAVLAMLKKDEQLHVIPVVATSGRDDMHNVDICYRLGIQSFIAKPVTAAALSGVLTQLNGA